MWHKVERDRGQVQGQRTSSTQGFRALGWGTGTCLCKPSILRHTAPGRLTHAGEGQQGESLEQRTGERACCEPNPPWQCPHEPQMRLLSVPPPSAPTSASSHI